MIYLHAISAAVVFGGAFLFVGLFISNLRK